MNIELKHKIINDKYTEYVYQEYDIQNTKYSNVIIKNNINLNFDWNIGVIYGGSGSGKTTLLKQFGTIENPIFHKDKSLISNFEWIEPKEAASLLTSMGLSSVPCWLRPYEVLSNGEQYRARMAYLISKAKENDVILIDEYTSVVDRDVAKAMSFALQKYIRREKKKIILASCHFDIMDWLIPDWIYSPYKGRVERLENLRQSRPKIELEIFRCRYETWNLFKQHHYISEELNKLAKCFCVTWNDKPVAFFAFLAMPSGSIQSAYRGSRSVVLPDYQGLGIGFAVSKYLHKLYAKNKKNIYTKSINPALVQKRLKDNDYKFNGKTISSEEHGSRRFKCRKLRETAAYSFRFIGSFDDIKEEELKILIFDAKAYKNNTQSQIDLFN